MNRPSPKDPIWQLIDLAATGELSDQQAAQLNDRLRNDRAMQQLFLEYLQMQSELFGYVERRALLQETLRMTEGNTGAEVSAAAAASNGGQAGETRGERDMHAVPSLPARRRNAIDLVQAAIDWRRSKVRFAMFALAATALLWFALLLVTQPDWMIRQRAARPDPGSDAARVVVAEVTGMHRAVWADETNAWRLKAQLIAGNRIELASGILEVTYRDGAELYIEGPASFEIDTTGTGKLASGRLTAYVPPPAVGFTIATPHARIVDLGTEFGIDTEDKSTHVFVQTGKVHVSLAEAEDDDKGVIVTSGGAVEFREGGKIVPAENPDAGRFTWKIPPSDEATPAAIDYHGSTVGVTDWVDRGWGADGYLFFGCDLPDNREGKTLGVLGIQKKGEFLSSPSAVDKAESGTMTTHGDHPGGPTAADASAAVALQHPSGNGTFSPGGLYRRRMAEEGLQGVFQVQFTQDVPSVRIGVLLDNQWIRGDNTVPPRLQLTLSTRGRTKAVSPILTPDDRARQPRADWYFFDATGITRGDLLTVKGERVNGVDQRYVHVGGLTFQKAQLAPPEGERK